MQKVFVNNSHERAHYERANLMIEHQRRKYADKAETSFSDYLFQIGILSAVAEDASVEALAKFCPSAGDKRAISKLPKNQRKAYIKQRWPWYRNELKQAFDNINVHWFEDVAAKAANRLDDDLITTIMDNAVEKLRKDVFVLRQSIKRSMGRWKDSEGRHMEQMEEKSYLFTAYMLWERVAACHDVHIMRGLIPVGADMTDEVQEYLLSWSNAQYDRISKGLKTENSRFYNAQYASVMMPMRPTRIVDGLRLIVDKIIGWRYDATDKRNHDIVFADDIILRKTMKAGWYEDICQKSLDETEKFKTERQQFEAFVSETGKNHAASLPLYEAMEARNRGNMSSDDILHWIFKEYNMGNYRIGIVRDVLMWMDKKLPPVNGVLDEARKVLKNKSDDEDKFMTAAEGVVKMLNEHPDMTFYEVADEMKRRANGNELILKAVDQALAEMQHYVGSEQYYRKLQRLVKCHTSENEPSEEQEYEQRAETPDVPLEPQPAEPAQKKRRWCEDDERWLLEAIDIYDTPVEAVAVRLGRTIGAVKSKYAVLKREEKKRLKEVKPLKLMKA